MKQIQKNLTTKIVIIIFISLVLLIPLAMVSDQIRDRQRFLAEATQSVAQSWTGRQQVVAPILVIPYEMIGTKFVYDSKAEKMVEKPYRIQKSYFLKPKTTQITVDTLDSARQKGIYSIPVYTSKIQIKAELASEQIKQILSTQTLTDGAKVKFEPAYISVMVSDPRGINRVPNLKLANQTFEFYPGSKLEKYQNGLHAQIGDLKKLDLTNLTLEFEFDLRGMEQLAFVPVGNNVSITAKSNWPHPQFTGQFLPTKLSISDAGYQAQWQVTSFASNIQNKLDDCANGECKALLNSALGIKHIEAVDVYLQSERSTKYGILFIGLTFIAFFIFEVVKQLRIHPIQYTLVGLSISIFYLLLLSLSEHIAFITAYAIASFACVSLLMFYLYFVLKSLIRASLCALAIGILYAVLYVIISAEDFALAMGSALVFIVLTIIMIVTRNIDWYQVSDNLASLAPKQVPNEKPNNVD
ncbi:cell envelope integrity protein CreD [Catenovulum maritimum]|uniref:cell envelope integrity protein CreD n=1 Tax=Catenovulum maritimum TaxID=1513271 RepID=UPI000660E974|nr:cell envelope integrity protein CreD [Catenovulum maritimum]